MEKKTLELVKDWGFTLKQKLYHPSRGTVRTAEQWAHTQIDFNEGLVHYFARSIQPIDYKGVLKPVGNKEVFRDEIDGDFVVCLAE